MRQFLNRLYPALLVAAIFAVVAAASDGFLDTIDYVAAYIVFVFFYMPVLVGMSIWEMIDIPRPEFIRNWIAARRQAHLQKGPLNYNRVTVLLVMVLIALCAMIVPTAHYLSEAASAQKQELADSSIVERLLLGAAIMLSIVVALVLLTSNLLRRGFIDWNVNRREELAQNLPGCMHCVKIGLLVVMSPMLLIASRFGQFISGNFGFPVLVIVQLIIALILLWGDRFLRQPQP